MAKQTLDELESLNHYAFAGRRDMTRDFNVLVVNHANDGEETLTLASQLLGTGAIIVHYDPDADALERVKRRATAMGVSAPIRFFGGALITLQKSLESQSGRSGGFFDYVRFTRSATDTRDLASMFGLAVQLTSDDGVVGFSTFGQHGREPYRQLRVLARHLSFDEPSPEVLLQRLKELFVFLPEYNWTKLAFDNLEPQVRRMNDEAFVRNFFRDETAMTVPQLYSLFARFSLHNYGFARERRAYYNAWFLRPNLATRFNKLTPQAQQEFSDIGWGLIEEHHCWAGRRPAENVAIDLADPNAVPFVNRFVEQELHYASIFRSLSASENPAITIPLSDGVTSQIQIPWGEVESRFVKLVDGEKTLATIAATIHRDLLRDTTLAETPAETPDANTVPTIGEIRQSIAEFLRATSLHDVFLLRHRDCPPLPTSRWDDCVRDAA
ncbi:MAG: hypothetical protein ACRC46_12780 [Thermoguttaceae bacterium]